MLLNESLVNAKNIIYLGLEVAMTEAELSGKLYIDYLRNKEKIPAFYRERYGGSVSKMVERVLELRSEYLKHKDNPIVAREMFGIALGLANEVRNKVLSSQ